MTKAEAFPRLLDFLRQLDAAHIYFTLARYRDDAIMVQIAVPGQLWEVEFVEYADRVDVEVERFVSGGGIEDGKALEELFARFAD